ncbi:hypothetical protein K402DRAFT_129831 [Aulographum hederae CBS 113979]|uniref:Zn(2)-C6 fungal-type domain-containing protein n=1 Tax=Aulographum hederae CBS 113979 TaxID=1176131 RepID=A0A6G1HEH4_9PEZI|nr:hypothetical protein K402DRAFT_129831 [Aulographum hederae CBS 113979]
MNTGNQRRRLACIACTRRKVKCDKEIPCKNCIRRGVQHLCSRNEKPGDTSQGPARESTILSSSAPTEVRESRDEQASMDEGAPSRDSSAPPAVVEDCASILEFLAWGRRKNPDYKTVASPELHGARRRGSCVGDISQAPAAPGPWYEGVISPIPYLQILLPERTQLYELAAYHENCILWYTGSYDAPLFREQLDNFYSKGRGVIENDNVKLQWTALLFAVIATSLSCAPRNIAIRWGFQSREQDTLSKEWYKAVMTCLNTAEYMANHSIYAVEAIATLTLPGQLLGFSNNQNVLLSSAVRIGQSLGLHRLGKDITVSEADVSNVERGRRVWCQLCQQDWYNIPFSESYSINPLYTSTSKPINCHDSDMKPQPDTVPTRISLPRFKYEIARLMPGLQDGIRTSNTSYTKFEQVMKYDRLMRNLSTEKRPSFLSSSEPLDESWPAFVPWARRAATISTAHKMIMIHRAFLGQSFLNPAFAVTRKTCIAAAKTILKEERCAAKQSREHEDEGPVLWIYHAFAVAASIVLSLDLLHRKRSDPEYSEHRQMVQDGIEILRNYDNSAIAIRGVRLLSALLVRTRKPELPSAKLLKHRSEGYQTRKTILHANARSFWMSQPS